MCYGLSVIIMIIVLENKWWTWDQTDVKIRRKDETGNLVLKQPCVCDQTFVRKQVCTAVPSDRHLVPTSYRKLDKQLSINAKEGEFMTSTSDSYLCRHKCLVLWKKTPWKFLLAHLLSSTSSNWLVRSWWQEGNAHVYRKPEICDLRLWDYGGGHVVKMHFSAVCSQTQFFFYILFALTKLKWPIFLFLQGPYPQYYIGRITFSIFSWRFAAKTCRSALTDAVLVHNKCLHLLIIDSGSFSL